MTAEFLAYLAEVDERQIFLDLGFSSLFEYCVEKLGLCESTAGRHIAAARVCRNHPEAFAMVASGALHASALSLLRKHVTPENAAELFGLCAHRSARKVEEVLAARFPRPDVRDLVRRLPARAEPTPGVGCDSESPLGPQDLRQGPETARAPGETRVASRGALGTCERPFMERRGDGRPGNFSLLARPILEPRTQRASRPLARTAIAPWPCDSC